MCVYVRYKNGSHCERKLTRILRYVFSGHRWRYIDRKSTSTLLFMRIGRARACTPFDSLSRLFVFQVLVIVNCCMLLIYMHRQTFTTYSLSLSLLLFFQFNWWRRNWVRYLCVRQSIVHALAHFFKCSYGRQCDKKNEKE
jgi:hypothetical protein